jgi:hypothetical protein
MSPRGQSITRYRRRRDRRWRSPAAARIRLGFLARGALARRCRQPPPHCLRSGQERSKRGCGLLSLWHFAPLAHADQGRAPSSANRRFPNASMAAIPSSSHCKKKASSAGRRVSRGGKSGSAESLGRRRQRVVIEPHRPARSQTGFESGEAVARKKLWKDRPAAIGSLAGQPKIADSAAVQTIISRRNQRFAGQ